MPRFSNDSDQSSVSFDEGTDSEFGSDYERRVPVDVPSKVIHTIGGLSATKLISYLQKAAAPKALSKPKAKKVPIIRSEQEEPFSIATSPRETKKKTVEEIYQKKTQLEHILLRPDTYIGSVEAIRQPMWVWDEESGGIVMREITYVPGFYKIFDEILVNAADNKV